MNEDPTTLRSLWASLTESLQGHGQVAADAIATKGVVDWPIWLLIVLAPVAIIAVLMLLPVVGMALSFLVALVHAVKESIYDLGGKLPGGETRYPAKYLTAAQVQMLRERRGQFSLDPAERLRWANREGEFADE